MNLYDYFHRSWQRNPDKEALFVEDKVYSYGELEGEVARIAHGLSVDSEEEYIGLLAHKSLTAYASVLGILRSGCAYVPLNPKFPVQRNRLILQHSGIKTIVLGPECIDAAVELLGNGGWQGTLVIHFSQVDLPETLSQLEGVTIVECASKGSPYSPERPHFGGAYLLFTSGSTGIPKGVPISHANVAAYVDYLVDRYQIGPEDRFSQTFDLNFDLSVHDMFL